MHALILIVDDEAHVRVMLKEFLELKGAMVIEAENGTAAFEMAEKHKPKAIIMDVMMPSTYGTAAAKRMQEFTDTSKIPIIIHSGVQEEAARKLLPDTPNIRFMKKPADLSKLWEWLQEMIGTDGKPA